MKTLYHALAMALMVSLTSVSTDAMAATTSSNDLKFASTMTLASSNTFEIHEAITPRTTVT